MAVATVDADVGLEARQRKLVLDNEDLRFECARLRASLEHAQHEILALTERSTLLQRRLDRIYSLAPRGSFHLVNLVKSLFKRR